MRHVVLDLALLDVHFGSFSLQWPMIKMLGHYRCLNFGCDPRDGASEPCDVHKYKSCASHLAHLHHPCNMRVQSKYEALRFPRVSLYEAL